MSPLFAPIILALLVGLLVFIAGLVARKKALIIVGSPAVLLLLAWYVGATIPPNPDKEFKRVFGREHHGAVTGIKTRKPTLMDGHFLSFQISRAEFDRRIRPQLNHTGFTNFHLLRGQDLPSGWPQSVAETSSALHKKIGNEDVLVYYDFTTESAYASVQYDQW